MATQYWVQQQPSHGSIYPWVGPQGRLGAILHVRPNNGSTWPAFLWQTFLSKSLWASKSVYKFISERYTWVKYQSFAPSDINFETIWMLKMILTKILSQKSWLSRTIIIFECSNIWRPTVHGKSSFFLKNLVNICCPFINASFGAFLSPNWSIIRVAMSLWIWNWMCSEQMFLPFALGQI